MVDLPESAAWHPLKAAREYEVLAEEASGKAVMAFTEYARLRGLYVDQQKEISPTASVNALMYMWKDTDSAKSCASDLATYRDLAGMYAAMASMKHTRYLSDQDLLDRTGGHVRDL